MNHPAGVRQRVLDLQKPPKVRKFANSGLAPIDRDTHRRRYRVHIVTQLFQELLALMDCVAVVGISGVPLDTLDDLHIVVDDRRVENTGNLSHLISDVHVFVHELLAGQKASVNLVMLQRVEDFIHADPILFIGHIGHIDP